MFRAGRDVLRDIYLGGRHRRLTASFSSSPVAAAHTNRRLNLDPSLQALLQDVDISLTNSKPHSPPTRRELDILPLEGTEAVEKFEEPEQDLAQDYGGRKSPAAHFGSQRIGSVVLPLELQNSINLLISESDKALLHNDARRLFQSEPDKDGKGSEWGSQYDQTYRSRVQSSRFGERDATAFASIALPAHYSAIAAVFDHLKHRLEPGFTIKRVIDWGSATGSGLWASLHAFQKPGTSPSERDLDETKVSDTTVETYLSIDKRDGLTAIAKRLLNGIDANNCSFSWQRAFQEDDKIPRSAGHDTLALSAFMLTSMPTPIARKALIKEMWESGAHTIVLIDHNTTAGFESIAEARHLLLKMGRSEFEDPEADGWDVRGCHVIAPCPHDKACPLHHPGATRLVCGFSQRLQRPSFIRLTKHSGQGHEDIEYSYVVLRRGERPVTRDLQVGRTGEIGRRALDKDAESRTVIKELALHDDSEPHVAEELPPVPLDVISDSSEPNSRVELEAALRLEAYDWPRLNFPPLKRSGHIILDACTPEGKIMRMTIPKSQGKQPYYDARKSTWGDIFPHEPKNTPQERYQPTRAKRGGGTTATRGSDIGKRREKPQAKHKLSYDTLAAEVKENKKHSRMDRVRHMKEKRPSLDDDE